MLALANDRIEKGGLDVKRIKFIRADVLEWEPPVKKAFDLVVTHFFLDCFRAEQLQRIVDALGLAASQNASWLLADFHTPFAGLERWRAKVILKAMYLFFRMATRLPAQRLMSPDPYLTANDFYLRERRVSEWGLLHSDLWERTVR